MSRPFIGLVGDRKRVTSGAWKDIESDALPRTYAAAIEAAGAVALIIPPAAVDPDEVARMLDSIDGLFLPGGRDIDAEIYGRRPHPANDEPVRERDDLEIALVRGARDRGIPILGACRGLQVLNVALGGTLEQHIADDRDMTPHRDVIGTFTSHVVRVSGGTMLADLVESDRIDVASHHHQGVDEVADGLTITAVADDGSIEALEAEQGAFCVGVQWHPEEQISGNGLALFRAFIHAARERKEA